MSDLDAAKELFFKGLACLEQRDVAAAERFFRDTLKLAPRSIPTLNNLAIALHAQNKFADAALTAQQAIDIDPANLTAYAMLSTCRKAQDRYDDALAPLDKILEIDAANAEAHYGRAVILSRLNRDREALASFDRALAIQPGFAEAWSDRGRSLRRLKRHDEALSAYDKALAIKPGLAEGWLGRGNVLTELRRFDEALAACDKALALKPDLAEAWRSRANALTELKRFDEAFAAFDKALALKPDLVGIEGTRLHAKMLICDWRDFDAECERLVVGIRTRKANTDPFSFVGVVSSAAQQLECARTWIATNYRPSARPAWTGEVYRHERIRLGYVSANLHQHAISYLMEGVFANHDRTRFEVAAISIGDYGPRDMRPRMRDAFEHLLDGRSLSDAAIAQWIREKEIDILVDLNGFTGHARTGIFASRPAPIQVNYLGFPGTMGASYMDYLIADPTLIPDAQQADYAEKIAYLPHSYMPHDGEQRFIAERPLQRSEFGLPQDAIVFCCFNNTYKLHPHSFAVWMRILRRVGNGVLWLSAANAPATANLKKAAAAAGIDPARLIFAERVATSADHLARHRLADLFLDTLPYNAHTTASDALWAGLPVLTQIGATFAGRVAASLSNSVGLPEMIVTTAEAYEELAVELATRPDKLAAVKRKLADARLAAPLFDTGLFTRHIESLFRAMYERCQAGLPADHIRVA
ncbi:MAG TPA: tetratricopeptide repeat protein [Pseudolabrys sp.]|nr:tetratricopeptide repeat protein [Pseudolabrys sp.]